MLLTRTPRPALRPFIKTLWVSVPDGAAPLVREHVLPTGDMHLALRLSGPPLRVYGSAADTQGQTAPHAVVSGPRSAFYIREAGGAVHSLGVLLQPGVSQALFGAPADELAGRHTPLCDLWGQGAGLAMDQLQSAVSPDAQLDCLEDLLARRLPRVQGMHPAVAQALHSLQQGEAVQAAVQRSGYSHRRLIALFHGNTGLTPKVYARLLRFQAVLRRQRQDAMPWAELAPLAGYSDQAHMTRDFREFSGLTPDAWRRAAPAHAHHVPVAAPVG